MFAYDTCCPPCLPTIVAVQRVTIVYVQRSMKLMRKQSYLCQTYKTTKDRTRHVSVLQSRDSDSIGSVQCSQLFCTTSNHIAFSKTRINDVSGMTQPSDRPPSGPPTKLLVLHNSSRPTQKMQQQTSNIRVTPRQGRSIIL